MAQAFEAEGASPLVPSCGFTAKTPLYMLRGSVPVREVAANRSSALERWSLRLFCRLFVQRCEFRPLFLLEQVLQAGFPFVEVGRATVKDPRFAARLRAGEIEASDCDQCNRCIAVMEAGGVYCVTGEEQRKRS